MSYSPQLVYYMDRMSGFSTNIFKLMPQGSPDAAPNSISRVTLPANALLNTRSFKLHFRATTSGTGARLPADLSTLVERVEVSAGGVQLSQGTNFYNTLCNAKAAIMGSKCDSVTGHSEVVRLQKFDGTSVGTGAGDNETYASGTPHVIDKWEGFLGTCEPKILDAAILPDLVVSVYWADNSVLASCSGAVTDNEFITAPGAPSAVYEIKDIHASIETIGLADSVYDNMVSSMIAQKGFVEIPFKQYFSFSNNHTGSSRFTVATQSLDRIWTAWRADGYNSLGAPHPVPGYGYSEYQSTAPIPTADVSAVNDTITLTAHGFTDGTRLVYKANGGAAIGGLANGAEYYVRDATADTFSLTHRAGHSVIDLTSTGNAAQTFQTSTGPSIYRGVFGTSGDKHLTKFQRFTEPGAAGALKYQFQLNGAYYPQYPADTEDMYQITKNSLPGSVKYDLTKQQLTDSYFVQCIRLNMPDSEFSRTASGLDTRSVSLNGYVNTTGTLNADPNLMIFAECTSSLRVGAGRQLEIII